MRLLFFCKLRFHSTIKELKIFFLWKLRIDLFLVEIPLLHIRHTTCPPGTNSTYYILSKHCQRNDLPRCLYPPPGHHVLGRQSGQQPVTGSRARMAQSEGDPGDQSSLAPAQDLGAAPTKLKWSLH